MAQPSTTSNWTRVKLTLADTSLWLTSLGRNRYKGRGVLGQANCLAVVTIEDNTVSGRISYATSRVKLDKQPLTLMRRRSSDYIAKWSGTELGDIAIRATVPRAIQPVVPQPPPSTRRLAQAVLTISGMLSDRLMLFQPLPRPGPGLDSRFDATIPYSGRNGADYTVHADIFTTGSDTVLGQLVATRRIEATTGRPQDLVMTLATGPLDYCGEGHYRHTWRNIIMPGVGICDVIVTFREDD
jgi:hypothetical protein